MLTILFSIIMVILLFGFTIFIHELGHFLVARWFGFQIDAFAIGMGPAIWKRKINGVEYKLCAFPIGGYVALPQMGPSEETGKTAEEDDRNLPPAKPLPKIAVALAGVTFNMIFAIALAYIIFWQSKSIAPEYETSAVGYVEEGSAAQAAGIQAGDVILSVNDEAVKTWEQFVVVAALNEEVTMGMRRGSDEIYQVTLPTERITGGRWIPGIYPMNYCVVLDTFPDSPARAAGLEVGDRITAIDGIELFSREQMIDIINASEGRALSMSVLRGEETIELSISPEFNAEHQRAMIGIAFRTDEVKKPWDQIKSHATLIFRILKALVTPAESKAAAEAIGGPVAIIDIFLKFAAMGFIQALWFTCLLNVNLAVMNLLPLPVLDGGHILFSIWELITRRPIPHKIVVFLWKASAMLLLALFVLLTFRDVRRIFADGSEPAADPVQEEKVVEDTPAEAVEP